MYRILWYVAMSSCRSLTGKKLTERMSPKVLACQLENLQPASIISLRFLSVDKIGRCLSMISLTRLNSHKYIVTKVIGLTPSTLLFFCHECYRRVALSLFLATFMALSIFLSVFACLQSGGHHIALLRETIYCRAIPQFRIVSPLYGPIHI